VGIVAAEPFAEVRAPAALEGVEMWMTVFLTHLRGAPAPAAEIAAVRWWPQEPAPRQAPAISDCEIPRLRLSGRL
jgi:8-oxo-dGTP diphosphatase